MLRAILNNPYWKKDWLIGLVVMLIVLLLANTHIISAIEWKAYDLGLLFSSVKPANKDIVVVAIDDRSLQAHGAWPWPRNILAEATRKLSRARPDVIGFSLPFDTEQNSSGLDQIEKLKDALVAAKAMRRKVKKEFRILQSTLLADQVLASRFRTSGRIVLAMPFSKSVDQEGLQTGNFPEYLDKFTLKNVSPQNSADANSSSSTDNPVPVAGILYPPIEILSRQVGGVGVISPGDNNPEHTRREPLVVRYADKYLPSFALMLVARHQRLATSRISAHLGDRLELAGKTLDTDRQFHFYPRYYKQQNNRPAFKVYSMADVLDGSVTNTSLRNKIVIVGVTSSQHATPVLTPIGVNMSPTLAIAHSVSSLLNNEPYKSPDWSRIVQALSIIAAGLYLMFLLPRFTNGTGFVISLLIIFAIFNIHFYFMISASTWIPLMSAVLTVLSGHLLIGARHIIHNKIAHVYNELSEANLQLAESFHSQGRLDKAFEKYRKCQVNQTLLNQVYNLGLDYERKRQFNKAVSVFEFIQSNNSNIKDIDGRLLHNREAANTLIISNSASNTNNSNLLLGKSGLQKPVLGRYQIDKEIGNGSMGRVYLGHDPKISRTVAIKTLTLSDEFESDQLQEVKERFFREAEAAGRLNHPNIVTIYDIGEDQDLSYIAMDYLKGKDLKEYCKEGHLLAVDDVLNIAMQIASALDYAHEQHVVHRDIKPENIIFIEETTTPIVTDFGVACLTDASKTKTGTVIGSPLYMSPEQLTGSKVDGRSDLYSLGVTLYQMLTGNLPFTGTSMANLMYKITNEKHLDIRVFRPDLPVCVANIINKSMHKDIQKRFQSGKQMTTSLKRCRDITRQSSKFYSPNNVQER